MTSVHGRDVAEDGLGEILRVHVESQDVEDLCEQLLLVEIVELHGGVHPVDDSVLVDESGKLSHDSLNKRSRVAKVVHDVGARNDVVATVHAVVESGDTVDVVHRVREGLATMFDRHFLFRSVMVLMYNFLGPFLALIGSLNNSKLFN